MPKSLTTLHNQLDRILEKMGQVDTSKPLVWQLADTNRHFARFVDIATGVTTGGREEGKRAVREVTAIRKRLSPMTRGARKGSPHRH